MYGNVPYNITDLVVCAQNSAGAHTGTPVKLQYGQECSVDPQAKTDELTGYGLTVELMTIITHANLSMAQGGIDLDTYEIVAGMTVTQSGTTPNQEREAHKEAGGQGLPYFGMVGRLPSANGSALLVGLMRCKLDSLPSLNVEQNQFVMGEVGGKSIRNPGSSYVDVPFILKQQETAGAITLTSAWFDTFFGIS